MFSFVHAADLHLDSPFRGITAESQTVADTLRSATFERIRFPDHALHRTKGRFPGYRG